MLVTLLEGTPDRLPAVALGSTVLLHVLRAAALFAIGFAVVTVLARAAGGPPAQPAVYKRRRVPPNWLAKRPASSKAKSTTWRRR